MLKRRENGIKNAQLNYKRQKSRRQNRNQEQGNKQKKATHILDINTTLSKITLNNRAYMYQLKHRLSGQTKNQDPTISCL